MRACLKTPETQTFQKELQELKTQTNDALKNISGILINEF